MDNIESQIENLTSEEEPYVGMPITGLKRYMDHRNERDCGCDHEQARTMIDPLAGLPLAMAYVPWQCWNNVYEPAEGWHRGTIFPELDLPFLGGGEC